MKEESIFLDVVGNSPTMRILQYLIEGRDFDYSLTDIANNSGVSWGTLHKIFPKFIENQIVTLTREIGRAKLFKINKENQIANLFIEIYDKITEINIDQQTQKITA